MRFIPLLILLVFVTMPFMFGGAAEAQPATTTNASTNPEEAQKTPAGHFIQTLGSQALSVMADTSLTPDQRTQKYRALLHDSFDMPTIGHFVIGRAWETATPDQQKTFMQLFEQLVLRTYGDRLNLYSGEGFQVKSVRQENEKDSMVISQVTHPDGSMPIEIDWRVRQNNGKMGVIDVIVSGVSQSVTQRQEYASIIARNNGNIDGLLDAMKQRLQEPQQTQQ